MLVLMANHRKFDDDQEKKILTMFDAGQSTTKIAKRLKAHPETVRTVVRSFGRVLRRGPTAKVEEAHRSFMVEEYARGRSAEDIAQELEVHTTTVLRCLHEAGVEVRPAGFRSGSDHHAWTGGRHVTEDGYVRVWLTSDDPFYGMAQRHSKNGGYVLEHRLVMARSLGRPLEEHETVHHVDGNKQNNDRSNLQLRQGRHGKGSVLVCADCGSHNLIHAPLESN